MSQYPVPAKKAPLKIVLSNKRVVALCLYACLPIMSLGFNLSILLPFPAFRKQFGHLYKGKYIVPAVHQSVWNCLVVPGGVLGAAIAGIVSDRLGRRYTFIIGSVIFSIGMVIQNVALDWKVMSVGKMVNYIGMAMYSVVIPTYISEVAPPEIRGIMLAQIGFILLVGDFLTSCVLQGTQHLEGRWQYHVPMILQFVIPLIMFIGCWFIPESPFWLVERGKTDAAVASLKLMHSGKRDLEQRLQNIQNTVNEQQKSSMITYLRCFQGSNLRRTLIAGGILAAQEFVGLIFIFSYTTYFFMLSGVPQSKAFTMTSIMFALQVLANMLAWYMIERLGRRFLLLTGVTCILISHFIIGSLGTSSSYKSGPFPKAVVSFMVILSLAYRLSLGSVAWVVSAEASSPALRSSTQAIAIMINAISAFVIFFTIPYLINPDQANLGPKVCFIYGSFTIFCLAFIYFFVPEMKGRTYDELNYMFQHRIPTRKFGDFMVPAGDVTQVSSNDEKSLAIKEVDL